MNPELQVEDSDDEEGTWNTDEVEQEGSTAVTAPHEQFTQHGKG